MAGTLWFDGPLPPSGDQFCTLCVLLYKGTANLTERVQHMTSEVNALAESEHRQISIISASPGQFLPGRKEPEIAVGMFLHPMVQQVIGQLFGITTPVPVPLCWSHMFGLQVKQSGVVPATAEQMPQGLPPGLGRGAVDMSQRGPRRERG